MKAMGKDYALLYLGKPLRSRIYRNDTEDEEIVSFSMKHCKSALDVVAHGKKYRVQKFHYFDALPLRQPFIISAAAKFRARAQVTLRVMTSLLLSTLK